MKKLSLLFAVFAWFAVGLYAQNVDAILHDSRHRIGAKVMDTKAQMILMKNGVETRVQEVTQWAKKNANDKNKIVIEFESPASIRGVRFLSLPKASSGHYQWIFVPTLRRVRRLAASEGEKSFQGTDFSNDDISSTDREPSEDINTLLRSETLDGNDCYVIQSVPKDSSYQYSKMIQWIDKSNKVCRKMELYDHNGDLKKIFTVSKLEMQGKAPLRYLTAMETMMTTITPKPKDRTSTTLKITKIYYGTVKNLPDIVFSKEFLERGPSMMERNRKR
jgi:outer membrane lipoprotein-sorting protein